MSHPGLAVLVSLMLVAGSCVPQQPTGFGELRVEIKNAGATTFCVLGAEGNAPSFDYELLPTSQLRIATLVLSSQVNHWQGSYWIRRADTTFAKLMVATRDLPQDTTRAIYRAGVLIREDSPGGFVAVNNSPEYLASVILLQQGR